MKVKFNILLVFIFICFIGTFYWIFKNEFSDELAKDDDYIKYIGNKRINKKPESLPNELVDITTPEGRGEIDRLYKKNKAEAVLQLIAIGANPEITFNGLIQDQYGDPVVNAVVVLEVLQKKKLSWDKVYVELKSDSDGYFFLNNIKGEQFTIFNLHKEGYTFSASEWKNFMNVKQSADDELVETSLDKPHVVNAWKTIDQEVNLKQLDLIARVRPDGTPYSLLIDESLSIMNIVEGKGKGNISVSVFRDPLIKSKVFNDWRFVMSVNGGGVIPIQGGYYYSAPENGYDSNWEFEYDTKNKNGNIAGSYRYHLYLKFGKNPLYGRLRLSVTPFFNSNDAVVKMKLLINQDGERNLLRKEDIKKNNRRMKALDRYR